MSLPELFILRPGSGDYLNNRNRLEAGEFLYPSQALSDPRSSFYSVRMMGRVASWSQGCFPCAPAMSEAPRSVEQGLLADPLDGSGVGTVAGG